MAVTAIESLFRGHPAWQIAGPAGMLIAASILADLPELSLMVLLGAYATLFKNGGKDFNLQLPKSWKSDGSSNRFVETCKSKPWAVPLAFSLALLGFSVQLAVVLITVFAYIALQGFDTQARSKGQSLKGGKGGKLSQFSGKEFTDNGEAKYVRKPRAEATGDPDGRSPSPPKVEPKNLDEDVEQLVNVYTAVKSEEHVMRNLHKMIKRCILPLVPEAEIELAPHGNLMNVSKTGFKAEIDVTVTIDPDLLRKRLLQNYIKGVKNVDTLLPDAIQKTATKALSERLTFVRFWRSQFQGPEPKIVLLVPQEIVFSEPILINFAVNAPYPMRLATLVSKADARNNSLSTLVMRWAKERAIANSARGQLPLYAWALLVTYFLRKNCCDEQNSTAQCFKEFIKFYMDLFQNPFVIVFSGEKPELSAESQLFGLPYVQDPFDVSKNLAEFMTVDGVARVKEELTRVNILMDKEGLRLDEVMQRWFPPANKFTYQHKSGGACAEDLVSVPILRATSVP